MKPPMITFLKLSDNKNIPYVQISSHPGQTSKFYDCLKIYREKFQVTLELHFKYSSIVMHI